MDNAVTKKYVIIYDKGLSNKTILSCDRNDHIIKEKGLDGSLVRCKRMPLEFIIVKLVGWTFYKRGLHHINLTILVETCKECFYAVWSDGVIAIKKIKIFSTG